MLKLTSYIDLPPHVGNGAFDHADMHVATDRLYVAHTANDAIDVIDCARDVYVESFAGFTAVAGALAGEALVFTSNRGENTVSIFAPGDEASATKLAVGVGPNGLAFDPQRGLLLAANVGDSAIPGSASVTLIDVARRSVVVQFPMPGRTRWAMFDPKSAQFFVNIANPAVIARIDAQSQRTLDPFAVPAKGPHGLAIDHARGHLLCACDAGVLVVLDSANGAVRGTVALSGAPDVVFLHPTLDRLYVAIEDPGVIDVIDLSTLTRLQVMPTEPGAHTLALDQVHNKLYCFLPQTHRAVVFHDAA